MEAVLPVVSVVAPVVVAVVEAVVEAATASVVVAATASVVVLTAVCSNVKKVNTVLKTMAQTDAKGFASPVLQVPSRPKVPSTFQIMTMTLASLPRYTNVQKTHTTFW